MDQIANSVITLIDNGSICVYTNVPAHVFVDISGWFSGEAVNAFVGRMRVPFVDAYGRSPARKDHDDSLLE